MPVTTIHVRPALHLQRPFARWATAQNPKVSTVGPATFAVPAALFTQVPEWVLIGATVDGQPYVSPQTSAPRPAQAPTRRRRPTEPSTIRPDRVSPRPDSGTTALAGLEGAPARATLPGGGQADSGDGPPPGTPTAVSASTRPDTEPDAEADTRSAADESRDEVNGEGSAGWPCGSCDRTFTSKRGRKQHRRRAHSSSSEG